MLGNRTDRKIAIFLIAFVFLATAASATFYFDKGLWSTVKAALWHTSEKSVANNNGSQIPKNLVAKVTNDNPPPTAKSTIAKEPPKHSTSSKSASQTTTTNNPDGTKTTTVSENGVSSSEVSSVSALGPAGASPYSIRYSDETGNYSTMEKTLKDYLNSTLRWSNEISYMYQITVRNAGDTGWEGQYSGSYNVDSNGKIVSAFGYIVLNVYYHKDSPQFNDYMKLVLAHEYGHHYTLWHKWVDLNLPVGTRFPDSYYSVRPLSKSTTAPDYSLGWQNCETEIIAEDYSYLYSGYGYHAMSQTYGYPSAATKTWLDNLSSAPKNSVEAPAAPTADTTPPSVSLTEPANGSSLTGTITLKANASDNVGVQKVGFYVNNALVAEDASSPYEAVINTQAYNNGTYVLKAVAYDNSNQTAESSISVIFNNNQSDTEKPVATIFNPSDNPHDWSNGDLTLEARATDNRSVTKIEYYVGDHLLATQNDNYVGIIIRYFASAPTDYVFTVKAYDAAGNIGQSSITIKKQ